MSNDGRSVEPVFSVKARKIWMQTPTTLRDHPDPTPISVDGDIHLAYQPLCRLIPFLGHRALIGIFNCECMFLQLLYALGDTPDQVERLKSGDHNWDAVLRGEREVFPIPHH